MRLLLFIVAMLILIVVTKATAIGVFSCTETASTNGGFSLACTQVCSNKLDFSQACNSQYINVVGF